MKKEKRERGTIPVALDREIVKAARKFAAKVGYKLVAGRGGQFGTFMLDCIMFVLENAEFFADWKREQELAMGSPKAWAELEGACWSKVAKVKYPNHDVKNGHCLRCGSEVN